jgi:hypothetical protein
MMNEKFHRNHPVCASSTPVELAHFFVPMDQPETKRAEPQALAEADVQEPEPIVLQRQFGKTAIIEIIQRELEKYCPVVDLETKRAEPLTPSSEPDLLRRALIEDVPAFFLPAAARSMYLGGDSVEEDEHFNLVQTIKKLRDEGYEDRKFERPHVWTTDAVPQGITHQSELETKTAEPQKPVVKRPNTTYTTRFQWMGSPSWSPAHLSPPFHSRFDPQHETRFATPVITLPMIMYRTSDLQFFEKKNAPLRSRRRRRFDSRRVWRRKYTLS